MSPVGEIPAPEALILYLRSFSGSAQQKGEQCFRQDRVQGVHLVTPGSIWESTVQGTSLYLVRLRYSENSKTWDGECGCPVGLKCKHLFAAGKALLAENNLALVNGLVTGARQAGLAAQPPSELEVRLGERLGRKLTNEEQNYLRTIHRIYLRVREARFVTHHDLHSLGIYIRRNPWEPAHLWHDFPPNEYWFWLYVARAAKEARVVIPSFMEPVTDLDEIRQHLAEREARLALERWEKQLETFRGEELDLPAAGGAAYDFRVVFGRAAAFLEWKPPGRAEFEAVRYSQLRDLLRQHAAALGDMAPEAEIILQTFAARIDYGSEQFAYYDPDNKIKLARLLLKPSLASRTVGPMRQPFIRVQEPLRWSLDDPSDAGEDHYEVRLARADGTPLPEFLFVLEGNPTLYVTNTEVYLGPPKPFFFEHQQNASIPAAVIESEAGIRFLERLGVPVPERISGRVRKIACAVEIHCRLDRLYVSDGHEICAFEMRAKSSDGRRTWQWDGNEWFASESDLGKPPSTARGEIVVYDEKPLRTAASLLEILKPRPSACPHRWTGSYVRVSKHFPNDFVAWLQSIPPEIRVELGGELASLAQTSVSGRVRLEVAEAEIDWFDLKVVLDMSETTLTEEEIKLLLNARGGFVRLKNKGWRRLQFELTPEDDEQLARLGLTARELSAEPQRMHALQLADKAAARFLPEEQVTRIFRRSAELKARVTPEIPKTVQAELRPYQTDGFHFLAYLTENRFGGILADDMGLGKTLQTLTWLAWLRERSAETPTSPVLVVCPKSVMDNWKAEAAKFTPALRVRVLSGAAKSLLKALPEADLHVINYAQLRALEEELGKVHWLAVILDEGQYIKNPGSQTAQVARVLRATHRLVLSGTPIENRLLDLWSLMSFAMPGTLGTRTHFARLYDAKGDPLARRRLAARVRPFLLRRTKAQVAKDLPDRVEEDLFCEIEGEQRTLYRAELKRAQQMLLAIKTQRELAKQQFNFLTSLLRLRQICCHPRLFKGDCPSDGAKMEALLEQLEPLMEEGHKVLIFSQFVELLDLLKPSLKERGWPVFYLVGSTENRGELVASFQQTEGPALFLISLKAGGFGLNLTAASYVILFDPWWNPAVENQAIDRTHRIGQVNKVIAYRLLIKNSIEEKIRQLQKKKSALVEDVLGEEKFAQSLTVDDLRFLLADE